MRDLKSRMGVARLVLEETAGAPSHKSLSKSQAAAIVSMASAAGGELTTIDLADLSATAVGLKWAADADLQLVLHALTPETKALPPGRRRRSQQNYLCIASYGDDAFWAVWAKDT